MSVVAVIGLGYVGLPLVVEFGKHGRAIGFDISLSKVESCLRGEDPSRELSDEEMRASPPCGVHVRRVDVGRSRLHCGRCANPG